MDWGQLGTASGALALVLCVIFALRALALRSGLAPRATGTRRIRVIESRAIASRGRLHLIEVEGHRLLIGANDQSLSLLRDCGPATSEPVDASPCATKEPRAAAALRALLLIALVLVAPIVAGAEPPAGGSEIVLELPGSLGGEGNASALDLLGLLTVLAIAPSILLMATCFTRFVIVLAFVRQAIGVQHMPPNQVLIGLALFLTAFAMAPVAEEVAAVAYDPYVAGELSAREALVEAADPVRRFLLSQTREEDLALFTELAKSGPVADLEQIPLTTLLPSFLVSELRTAFEIGFVIFLPFLIIDLVVSSLLISMGMIVLPPIVVSLPFKIMLFVLVDGWNLILGSLVRGLS
jgi:flagellar biosynthetic protein FliP